MRTDQPALSGQTSSGAEIMRFVADTLRLGERLTGAERGVRPKGVHQRDLVSLEEAQGRRRPRRRPLPRRSSERSRPGKTLLRPSESRRAAAAEAAAGAGARRRPRRPVVEVEERAAPPKAKPAAKPRKKAGRREGRRRGAEARAQARACPQACSRRARPAGRLQGDPGLRRGARADRGGARGRQGRRGLPGPPVAPLDRREHLQGRRRQRPSGDGGVVRRRRPRPQRLPLRGRDRRPRAGGKAPRQADPGADLPRARRCSSRP